MAPAYPWESDFPYRTDEEWALHDAKEDYVAERIDLDEFERRVECVLAGEISLADTYAAMNVTY